jgi:hypothetical protein
MIIYEPESKKLPAKIVANLAAAEARGWIEATGNFDRLNETLNRWRRRCLDTGRFYVSLSKAGNNRAYVIWNDNDPRRISVDRSPEFTDAARVRLRGFIAARTKKRDPLPSFGATGTAGSFPIGAAREVAAFVLELANDPDNWLEPPRFDRWPDILSEDELAEFRENYPA